MCYQNTTAGRTSLSEVIISRILLSSAAGWISSVEIGEGARAFVRTARLCAHGFVVEGAVRSQVFALIKAALSLTQMTAAAGENPTPALRTRGVRLRSHQTRTPARCCSRRGCAQARASARTMPMCRSVSRVPNGMSILMWKLPIFVETKPEK